MRFLLYFWKVNNISFGLVMNKVLISSPVFKAVITKHFYIHFLNYYLNI
jgi:hypothetical protein